MTLRRGAVIGSYASGFATSGKMFDEPLDKDVILAFVALTDAKLWRIDGITMGAPNFRRGAPFVLLTLALIRPRSRCELHSLRTFLSRRSSLSPQGPSLSIPTRPPRRLSTPLLTPLNATPTSVRTGKHPQEDDGRRRGAPPELGRADGRRPPHEGAHARAAAAAVVPSRDEGVRGRGGSRRGGRARGPDVDGAAGAFVFFHTGPRTTAFAW